MYHICIHMYVYIEIAACIIFTIKLGINVENKLKITLNFSTICDRTTV